MNKKSDGSWKKLITYCRSYLPGIIIALIAAAVGAVLQIIGPDKLSEMTDAIMVGLSGSMNMNTIFKIGMVLIALYASSALLSLIQQYILATATQKISKNLREDISHKINRLPLSYFDKVSIGDVLSRATNDVDTIGQTLNQSIGSLVTAVAMFVSSLVMMFATNWIMALAAVGSTLIGFVIMMFIMSKSQRHFVAQQQELGNINGYIEEIYSGQNIVKVYNGRKAAKENFEQINEKLFSSAWRAQFISGLMMPIMGFIGNFGYVAVCVVGAALAMNGSITFGVIVAFMMYIRLFTQPLNQMAQAATSLQQAGAANRRVFEFMEEQELADESEKGTVLANVKGDVEFNHIRFGYLPEKPIIHDFSAQIKAGQKVAIVGPTGAGKTTLVNLLMRFYELDSGEILLDGVPIQRVTRENVHEQFCMVLQDTWIFEGTIRENIVYSKKGVADEAVINACKAVGLHSFIQSLPEGYDTVLTDKVSLSAGQKQLVTIARAMVQDAPMLILDEATSSIDTRTEIIIQQAMDKLTQGRTSFVIAHRLSTIKNADLILVMKDGDIIEAGNHEALLREKGFYAQLYNSQFEQAS